MVLCSLVLTIMLHYYLLLCHMWPTRHKHILTMISIALKNTCISYLMLTSLNSGTLVLKLISVRVWSRIHVPTNSTCMVILYLYALIMSFTLCFVKHNYRIYRSYSKMCNTVLLCICANKMCPKSIFLESNNHYLF